MPWVATDPESEKPIIPAKAEDSKKYLCTNCADGMFVRPHKDTESKIARHFTHYSDTGCVGETDVHFHAKMMAESLLYEIFEDLHHAKVEKIDNELCFKENGLNNQFADAGVRFLEEIEPWGKGLAIEVQHKNKSKRRGQSSQLYKKKDVSVLWLRPHQLLQLGDDAKNWFYKMILGKHKNLKRNRSNHCRIVRGTYPYIVFYNENSNGSETEQKANQIKHPKKSRDIYSGDRNLDRQNWKPRYQNTEYKSLTPETEDWHCEKHGCLKNFIKVYQYERDGLHLKIQRCEKHGEPSWAEITTRFGTLRRETSLNRS